MKQIDKNIEYYNAYGQKEFYKGTSFRVHKWSPDAYYFNNEQYVDWVIYNGALCVCARTHVSSNDNIPVLIYKQGVPIDIEPNPCWDFALGGLAFSSDSPLSDPTRIKLDNNSFYISNDEGKTWNYIGTVIIDNPSVNITADVVSVNDSDQAKADVTVVDGNHLKFSFSLPRGKDGKDGTNGTSGVDGNGFDYIFCLTETPTFDKLDPSSLEAVQDDSFIPEGWTSYSQQVNETNEYQWVSTRKKIQGSWGVYSKPVILNSYATEGIVPEVSFTSFVFCRTNSTWIENDILPQGGSYGSPYPTEPGTIGGTKVTWTDSIPPGTHQVWMTSRVFSTQDTSTKWAVPRVLTDTANFQVEYSRELVYSNPGKLQSYYDNDSINYEKNWRNDNSTWSDEGTDAIWMATATMHNGVWSDWTVNKIKGEDGNDGNPINVISEVATFDDLPECSTYNGNHGDAYIVTSYEGQSKVMFVYTGDDENCWLNIGPLAVQGAYLHIKYAKTLYDDTDTWNDWSDNNGETPDDYIGIYWDSVEDDSMDPSKYTWKKWTGEDGWGYEYIYQVNNTGIAPKVPNESEQTNGYVPADWSDDPISISEDMQYCWMCYRRKVDNIWTKWYGAKNNIDYAALWSRWGQDGPAGEDGASVEYIFARSSVNSINFDESGLSVPDNSWEYDAPEGDWNDNPQGVSTSNPIEWVCERIKAQGSTTWSEWSKPAVFSHYGEDGKDGPGVEYVFILDDTDPYIDGNVAVPTHINEITNIDANQNIDYEPEYDGCKWQDDVLQVTKLLPYCWCSIRRKKDGIWGKFETPTLWNKYIEGTTSVLVKIWKRSDVELSLADLQAPSSNASYNISTGDVTLTAGTENGWSASGVLNGGKYLYSLGANITYNNNDTTIYIKPEDWTILTLESVDGTNGQDGTGQSAISMTVDPDAILINVDNSDKVRILLNIPCTANYYYGTSLQYSTFSYSTPEGITITDGVVENLEHSFQINIPAGFELKNSIPVTITLSPNVTALENSDNSITELTPLSKNIYLNPIKSNDTWGIDLSTDQIIDHDDLNTNVIAKIIKNDAVYKGDDAKLMYLHGSNELQDFPEEGLNITHTIISDIGNEIVIVLLVNGQSILHQSISILKNGNDGNPGIGVASIHEHYHWSKSSSEVTGFDESSFKKENIISNGENWTYNTPGEFSATCPYLWNIETIEYSTGEYQSTKPSLISASGRGVKKITEYYLISNLASGVTFSIDENGNVITNPYNWSVEYNGTVTEDMPYLWNAELIEYTDGTFDVTLPIILSMYSKGEKGDNADPVYSITLDRYSENPLYIEKSDNTVEWLNKNYKFDYTFRKNNSILTHKIDYVINIITPGVAIVDVTQSNFNLILSSVIINEFVVTVQFNDVKTNNTLLEVPIVFTPTQAKLTVSLDTDTINLGYRKSNYNSSEKQYAGNSYSARLKSYINDKDIQNDIIDLYINYENLPEDEDIRSVMREVTVIKDWLDGILLDYPLYYKESLETNSDIMSLVDEGRLNELSLTASYRGTSLQVPIDITLTTNQLNPDYLQIYATPNVILPTDADSQVRVRIYSVDNSYVTDIELNNWPYILQYNIDNIKWVDVTSDHNFSMGYFLWSKKDILKNIKFRIVDKNTKSIVYTQEIVERVGLDSVQDYFNGLPNILTCQHVYTLDPDFHYEFHPNVAIYNPSDRTFFINKFINQFITITCYTSENVETRQVLAQKTFGIKYLSKVDTTSNVVTSNELPYTIESCGSYINLNPKYVSIFNLVPGFTTIVNSNSQYPDYQLDIPYYWSNTEHSFGDNITEDILNDVYALVGKSYTIKFNLNNIPSKMKQNVFWSSVSVDEDNEEIYPQCNGVTFEGNASFWDTSWVLVKIDYNSIIKDDGTVAVIPSVTYKSPQSS